MHVAWQCVALLKSLLIVDFLSIMKRSILWEDKLCRKYQSFRNTLVKPLAAAESQTQMKFYARQDNFKWRIPHWLHDLGHKTSLNWMWIQARNPIAITGDHSLIIGRASLTCASNQPRTQNPVHPNMTFLDFSLRHFKSIGHYFECW